jgi:hypothetical protein
MANAVVCGVSTSCLPIFWLVPLGEKSTTVRLHTVAEHYAGIHQVKELQGHLSASPSSLPYSPRVIYVSSKQASSHHLPSPDPTSDLQLLTVPESYDASKYVGDLVMAHLDLELSKEELRQGKQRLRCLIADPGIAATGMFVPYLPLILQFIMIVCFYLVRHRAWLYGEQSVSNL